MELYCLFVNYVSDGAGETVVCLLDVALLPVALTEAHPRTGETRVSLDGTGEQCFSLRAVVWEHV